MNSIHWYQCRVAELEAEISKLEHAKRLLAEIVAMTKDERQADWEASSKAQLQRIKELEAENADLRHDLLS